MAATQRSDDVRAVSDQFYAALDRMVDGDTTGLSAVWSHRDDVTTMHPIGGREVGWEAVEASWQGVAELVDEGEVTPSDRLVRVVDDVAYELVTEEVSMTLGGEPIEDTWRATNVYRLEDGEWKVVHHHADLNEAFVAVLDGLAGG